MENDILADVPGEGQSFDEILAETREQQEGDAPAESPTGTDQMEHSPSPDGEPEPKTQDNNQDESKLPFHKHPRWQQMHDRAERAEAEVNKLRQEMQEKLSSINPSAQTPAQLPDRFVKLYGDNPEAWKLYREEQEEMVNRAVERLRQEEQQKRDQEQEAMKQANEHVSSSLQDMHDEGLDFQDNELMKFMLDFKEKYGALPTDDKDNIDFRRGLQLMQEFNQAKTQVQQEKATARKRVADFTTSSKSRSAGSEKTAFTSQDMKNIDWDDLIGR